MMCGEIVNNKGYFILNNFHMMIISALGISLIDFILNNSNQFETY